MEFQIQDIMNGILRLCVADNDALDTCIDNHTTAHVAGAGIGNQCTCLGIAHGQIKGSADHLASGGCDNGILLGMDTAAQLIALATGNTQLLTTADTQVTAVGTSAGRTVIAGRNDLIILNDDGADVVAQAGGTLQNGLGDIEIIIMLVSSVHFCYPHNDRYFS